MKRIIDIFFAVAILVLTLPIIIATSIAIAISMGRPVLFCQKRPGLDAKEFLVYKFRSMLDAVDANGNELTDGERLTWLGRFIRRMSIDELPQLWNVILGDMSIVGPRPLLISYLDLYTQDQARRHDVLPGLTGWAQINGRNDIPWEKRLSLDIWYVDNQSVWLDLKIILKTPLYVILGSGVSQKGEATFKKYTGEADDE